MSLKLSSILQETNYQMKIFPSAKNILHWVTLKNTLHLKI